MHLFTTAQRPLLLATGLMLLGPGCQSARAPASIEPIVLGTEASHSLLRRAEPMFSVPPTIQDTLFLLEFVVGLDGRPERETIRILDAHRRERAFPQAPGFLDQVRDAVSQWQYQPGTFKGQPVRVLVDQPIIRHRAAQTDSLPHDSLPNKRLKLAGPVRSRRNGSLLAW